MLTFATRAIRRSELLETKQRPLPSAPRSTHVRPTSLRSMSGSDSQNISGRDYDDGDEAGNESFSPSTGGSTFDQIDEVEHVSADTEENEGPLQTSASTEDVSTSGRGKSPRVVVSALFPHLSPRTVEDVTSPLRRGGAPRELRDSGQISGPEASRRPNALPAPGEASSSAPNPRRPSASPAPAGASSSVPDLAKAEPTGDEPSTTRKKMLFLNSEVVQQQKCLLTRAEIDEIHVLLRDLLRGVRLPHLPNPQSYKKANLEPPDYGRSEKYEPKPIAARAVKVSSAEPSQGHKDRSRPSLTTRVGCRDPTIRTNSFSFACAYMVLDKAFVAAPAAPRPKTKVALGRRRLLPPADPPVANVSAPTPIDTSSGGATAPDLQVMHGQSRRGKEKRQDPEIEEVLTLKRTKRSSSSRPSELQEGLRERDSLAATLVDQIRDKVPGMQTIMGWSCNRLGEQIAEDILRGSGPGGYPRKGGRASPKNRSPRPRKSLPPPRAERRKISPMLKAESRAKKDLVDAEGRAEKAEKAEQEAIEKMKDASSFARFICSDEAIAKEFLTAFVNTEVGDKLVWIYGQWAFTSDCRAMQEQVHTTLTEGLEETDLPGEVADPSPSLTPSRDRRSDRPAKRKRSVFLLNWRSSARVVPSIININFIISFFCLTSYI
nr:histone-lysine N-methyltransferase SETD1A-like [Ipomoea batatas]